MAGRGVARDDLRAHRELVQAHALGRSRVALPECAQGGLWRKPALGPRTTARALRLLDQHHRLRSIVTAELGHACQAAHRPPSSGWRTTWLALAVHACRRESVLPRADVLAEMALPETSRIRRGSGSRRRRAGIPRYDRPRAAPRRGYRRRRRRPLHPHQSVYDRRRTRAAARTDRGIDRGSARSAAGPAHRPIVRRQRARTRQA